MPLRLPSSVAIVAFTATPAVAGTPAMYRHAARAVPAAFQPPIAAAHRRYSSFFSLPSTPKKLAAVASTFPISSLNFHRFYSSSRKKPSGLLGGYIASLRGSRPTPRRPSAKRPPSKERQLELDVKICLEEELPDDPEILNIAEMLRVNVPMAMKVAFDGLKDSAYKTRDTSVDDLGGFEKVELSVLLCNDDFIAKLNKEWRDEDHATDVLSMSQHIPGIDLPVLMLGDIVISVDTAARQAEERGHTLLDEIRILMVHGLLHLLGFDHEVSDEAEQEMEKEEDLVLKSFGWKGKGLIQSAYDSVKEEELQTTGKADDDTKDRTNGQSLRFYRPQFKYIFCDMDGTLLNSKSQVTPITAEALKEAMSRGIKIVIATGKARPAVIDALKVVGLAGENGVVSVRSPGVFLQGLLVYGRQGREIFRHNLDPNVCKEAFLYSWENKVPLIAFSQDRCLTLFEHPLVDVLHNIYHEPKAEIIPSVKHLIEATQIQKLLFYDTADGVTTTLRPHWAEALEGRAGVVQALPDMLEIVPLGTSKGSGVEMLLDHLGSNRNEVMAIGDGDNDVEMLQLASFGVALENGTEKTKAAADAVGLSNDDDGVADAIYKWAF